MKKFALSLTSLFLIPSIVLLGSCQSKESRPTVDPTQIVSSDAPLAASMQTMKSTLAGLLPFLVDRQAFEAPQNQGRIQKDIAAMRDISKNVSHANFKTHSDPSYGFLSEGFKEELQRSSEAFDLGKKEFARYSLMNLTSYCIECHTRTSSGPSFDSPELNQVLNRQRPLEKGEYLLAARQFDAALAEFMKVLDTHEDGKFNFYDFDRALRYALSITVKFQRDPNKTEMVIEKMSKSSKLPYFIRQASSSWSQSVQSWKKEKSAKNLTTAQRIQRADELVQRGRRSQQGQSDRSGDVDLLRGLSELHQIMWADLPKDQLGHVLYLTGQAYESVRDMASWTLHENYYETCVRRVPHTSWAASCYKSLEESLFMGYTGTSGTHIPMDVQVKLSELEKLAKPLNK